MHRLHPGWIGAVLWTLHAARRAGQDAEAVGLGGSSLPSPSPFASRRRSTVAMVLGRINATCLVRALVLQCWDAAHERPRDVVVGVREVDGRVAAHAWLDGDPLHAEYGFTELHRRPATVLARR